MAGMTTHQDDRLAGLPIHFVSNHRGDADSMVVLMPSALAAGRQDRARPGYARWSWQSAWPTSLVLAFADPAMQVSQALNGAWFIHREHDVVAALAAIAGEIADAAEISADRVLFYGSSLGGFGALACAAHVPGAHAVAEVPQINVGNWFQSAVAGIERHILHQPMTAFEREHPERVCIRDRFRYAGLVPPFRIISNPTDDMLSDQKELVAWSRDVDLPRLGGQRLDLTDRVSGHKALLQADAFEYVGPGTW